jgi:hypothetical protein
MPAKSRRNRRIPQNNRTANTTTNAAQSEGTTAAAVNIQQDKGTVAYSNPSKSTVSAISISTNFIKDIKWIGLVTVIIIALLIVSYVVFH